MAVLGEAWRGDRLEAKSWVLGVITGGHAKAYSLRELNKTLLLYDELGGTPVLGCHRSAQRKCDGL